MLELHFNNDAKILSDFFSASFMTKNDQITNQMIDYLLIKLNPDNGLIDFLRANPSGLTITLVNDGKEQTTKLINGVLSDISDNIYPSTNTTNTQVVINGNIVRG